MSYINNKNLDSYYVDFYKQELIGNPEDSKDNIVEHEIDGIITILNSYNSVIDFLITNKNSWKIEGENIIFTTEDLSNKFLELINDMLENIPGTLIEKDFGTYEIPVDWIESVAHSTNDKFFYVKEGQENENRPDNISVNEGTNKYPADEHEKFRSAILNQLSMQIGGDENVELNANGSNTKNGYVVYTFNIKDISKIDMNNTFFHYTAKNNLSTIIKNGLEPRIGKNSLYVTAFGFPIIKNFLLCSSSTLTYSLNKENGGFVTTISASSNRSMLS